MQRARDSEEREGERKEKGTEGSRTGYSRRFLSILFFQTFPLDPRVGRFLLDALGCPIFFSTSPLLQLPVEIRLLSRQDSQKMGYRKGAPRASGLNMSSGKREAAITRREERGGRKRRGEEGRT